MQRTRDFSAILGDLLNPAHSDGIRFTTSHALSGFAYDRPARPPGALPAAGISSYISASRPLDRGNDIEIEMKEIISLAESQLAARLNFADHIQLHELRSVRRTFAVRFHPDRLPAHLRHTGEAAMKRINAMIDLEIAKRGHPKTLHNGDNR